MYSAENAYLRNRISNYYDLINIHLWNSPSLTNL